MAYANAAAFDYAGYGNEFAPSLAILSVRTPFPLSEEGEESTLARRHSFIQMTKLSNVRGRITYPRLVKKDTGRARTIGGVPSILQRLM